MRMFYEAVKASVLRVKNPTAHTGRIETLAAFFTPISRAIMAILAKRHNRLGLKLTTIIALWRSTATIQNLANVTAAIAKLMNVASKGSWYQLIWANVIKGQQPTVTNG